MRVVTYKTTQNEGDPPVSFDLDGAAFWHKANWIAAKGSMDQPVIEEYTNVTVNSAAGNVSPGISITSDYQAVFAKNGVRHAVDVLAVWLGPVGVLASLSAMLNLGLSLAYLADLRYSPPAPPEPPKDWEDPDAPIGTELPGIPGGFKSAGKGQPEGTVWTARSGNRYKCTHFQAGFVYFVYWQKL